MSDSALERFLASLGPEVGIDGVPDGLVARSVQKVKVVEGVFQQVGDRQGRMRLELVALAARSPGAGGRAELPNSLSTGDQKFVLGAARRSWHAVEQRFGDRAWQLAIELARRGILILRCSVTDSLRLGRPVGWLLSSAGVELADALASSTSVVRRAQENRRLSVLAVLAQRVNEIVDSWPGLDSEAVEGLRAALETARGSARLPVLTAVAEDLVNRVKRSSPRDFSIAHFDDSKERDDVASLLSEAGVPADIALALGLARSPRIGVGGAVDALVAEVLVELSRLDGPTLVRVDQPGLRLVTDASDLIIVENLQAAEALQAELRARSQFGLIYTAGQPSAAARRLIGDLCDAAERVLLCPDADLGGVRIAAAILGDLPAEIASRVTLCDVGLWPHVPQPPWPADGASVTGLTKALHGPAAGLARSCLARGYRVEQEQNVLAAMNAWLGEQR